MPRDDKDVLRFHGGTVLGHLASDGTYLVNMGMQRMSSSSYAPHVLPYMVYRAWIASYLTRTEAPALES